VRPVTRAEWIETLRSGKYQQAEGALVRGTANKPAFCCLGVLCEIAGVPREGTSQFHLRHDNPDDKFVHYIPSLLHKSVGLSADDQSALVYMNDNLKMTFAAIADALEAGPEPNDLKTWLNAKPSKPGFPKTSKVSPF